MMQQRSEIPTHRVTTQGRDPAIVIVVIFVGTVRLISLYRTLSHDEEHAAHDKSSSSTRGGRRHYRHAVVVIFIF